MANNRMTDEQLAEKYGRRSGGQPIDEPSELGYRCPRGHHMNDVMWSEFKEHIWCRVCKKDYHYAQDCRMMRPCWQSQAEFDKFIASLPQKPRVLKGIMHFPDCTIPHRKQEHVNA